MILRRLPCIPLDAIAHTVFDGKVSPQPGHGEKNEKVFDVTGEYDYTCGIHPFMRGKVIVK